MLIDTEGLSLVHCMAGKDRTGIALALLHEALGVHLDEAMDDFLLSNTPGDQAAPMAALAPAIRQIYGPGASDAVVQAALSFEPAYFETLHSAIVREAGGITNHLKTVLGVDARRLGQLRARLLCELG